MIMILLEAEMYFTVVMICISLVINGIEYISMCLLDIHITSLVHYLLKYFAHFNLHDLLS